MFVLDVKHIVLILKTIWYWCIYKLLFYSFGINKKKLLKQKGFSHWLIPPNSDCKRPQTGWKYTSRPCVHRNNQQAMAVVNCPNDFYPAIIKLTNHLLCIHEFWWRRCSFWLVDSFQFLEQDLICIGSQTIIINEQSTFFTKRRHLHQC